MPARFHLLLTHLSHHAGAYVCGLMLVLLILLAGCSGAAETTAPEPPPPPPPSGPALTATMATASGLTYHDLETDTSWVLVEGVTLHGKAHLSPDRQYAVQAYETADSSFVGLFDLSDGTHSQLYGTAGARVISVAWAPDGDAVAFGYYAEQQDGGMGAGGIRMATLDGNVRDVGCRASKQVYQVLPSGSLVTSDGRNLYVVAAEDCATEHSLDARKLHQLTFSPDGTRMAYIERELVYNRAARTYEPDSTLYIAEVTGANPVKVIGDKYLPRHLTWSPDGQLLAYDVQSQDHDDVRLLSVYDRATGQSSYIVPPDAEGRHSDLRPVWSPSGDLLAYTRSSTETGSRQQMVYFFLELRTTAVAAQDAAIQQWADDRHLILAPENGPAVAVVVDQVADDIVLPSDGVIAIRGK